ncbi:toxin Doc [Streptomyces sp. PSKA54]|uniref:Toxin Doc n=1 Tax=Streptomyces himalayensis subsp. aureolus TaxID=2758039 RepID=A0A7W2D963_9ACTN|nr:toxin Doc [Streptomyces himalayensis]MBA4867033.1 toxin Doc [Streptomyces himalayensis subsp. aureolus]
MDLLIDVRWLLERQAEVLPKQPEVHDFSNLVAAVARHRVNTPQIGATVDNAWRAAALMHAIIRLRPLPARNALYGAAVAVSYMNAAGEAIDPPYGAMIDLADDIDTGRADGYDAAARIRSWRI